MQVVHSQSPDDDVPVRRRRRHHERPGLDVVRDELDGASLQSFDAAYDKTGASDAPYSRPHLHQALRQVHHLRFRCRVLDDRGALR